MNRAKRQALARAEQSKAEALAAEEAARALLSQATRLDTQIEAVQPELHAARQSADKATSEMWCHHCRFPATYGARGTPVLATISSTFNPPVDLTLGCAQERFAS